MKNKTSVNLQQVYFFDLPLSDVYGIACAAMRLIYHGSAEGAFGMDTKEAIDLEHVDALQIALKHRTVDPLSEIYDYDLVYYRKEIANRLWSSKFRKGCPTLRRLTRRVQFSDKATIKPNRLRHFYIKSNRPVHVAKYGNDVPTDHCVPEDYIQSFGEQFEGYLMRSKMGFPLVTSLFDAQGLNLADRREVSKLQASSKHSPHVLVYSDRIAQRQKAG
ncbi:hypothetical protein HW115_02975 [Verrucomicrobiaceae bacterium N1E253]|uniref:Uncharacterized protein n=1 Tax=Oceaniferula marina TaxID=2748318 RepID=A0A851G9Z8_9BACT|nr:hypothetical protein [Oceaniferula marina]NWK54558.1 hypothetical protein [Oceaniferula marina]